MPRRVGKHEDAPAGAEELDLSALRQLVEQGDAHGNLIALLQAAQQHYGYLPEVVVQAIAHETGVPAARIYGIITFYAQFSTEPSGRHKIFVCHGTACHVAGASRVTEALEQELHVDDGDTTPDMEFTLGSVACMGACSQAPVMRVDDGTYGNLGADQTRKIIRELMKTIGVDYAAGAKGGE